MVVRFVHDAEGLERLLNGVGLDNQKAAGRVLLVQPNRDIQSQNANDCSRRLAAIHPATASVCTGSITGCPRQF